MDAEASITLRNSLSASGWPLLAMAPISHRTNCWASRLVLPMYSLLPRACSRAMAANVSSLASCAMSFWRGAVLATDSPVIALHRAPNRPWICRMSLVRVWV